MSCRFGSETDLAAYLLDPADPEFGAFRDHWPSCPDCSREMARLSRLEMHLRSAAPESAGGHPTEERLLLLEKNPGRLEAAQREAIARHLATCRTCSDELRALRSFEAAGSIAPAESPAAHAPRRPWRSRPALAAAAGIALALGGASVWLLRSMGEAESTPPPVARRVEIPVIAQSAPAVEPAAPPAPHAIETPPAVAPGERVAEAPARAVAREPVRQTPKPAPTEPPATTPAKSAHEIAAKQPTPATTAPHAETPEPIVVAALDPARLPVYLPPAGAGSGQRRFDGVVRGATDVATLLALAPDHVGRTAQAAPTLFFFVDRRSEAPMELSLVDPSAVEPLVEVSLTPPIAAGIHAVRLAGRGVALRPGVVYRWSVSLIRDAEHRAGDVVASGAIERVAAAIRSADTDALAQAGLFYDALAAASDEIAAHPDDPRRRARRVALLEQVGLGQAAAFDGRRDR